MRINDEEATSVQDRRWFRYVPASITILMGLVLTIAAFMAVWSWEHQRTRAEFKLAAEDCIFALTRDVESNLQILGSLAAFCAASQKVERQEFREYVQPFLAYNRSIQALEWIPHVPDTQRTAYEQAARQEGFPDFQITERKTEGQMVRAASRQEYFPVYFIEPYKRNELTLGFDLASNPALREALHLSRASEDLIGTGRITLVEEEGNQFGFSVFSPVCRKDRSVSSSRGDRRNSPEGCVVGVYRVGEILEHALMYRKSQGVDVSLYDKSAAEGEGFLGRYSAGVHRATITPIAQEGEAELRTDLRYATTLDVAARKWLVLCTPVPGYLAARRTWEPWGVLVAGLIFTGLLAAYFIDTIGRTERIQGLVRKRTAELQRANEELEREIVVRTTAEEALQEAHAELERRVKERTRELITANEELKRVIEERKRAEEALRQSEERYRLLVETTSDWVWTIDVEGRLIFTNGAVKQLLGYDVDEILGSSSFSAIHSEDRVHVQELHQEAVKQERGWKNAVVRWLHRDGAIRFLESTARPIFDAEGHLVGFSGIDRDITDRKQAEEALRESEKKYRDLVDNSLVGVYKTNFKGDLIYVNEALAKMLEFESPEEMMVEGVIPRYKNSKDRELFLEIMKESGRVANFEVELVTRTGVVKNVILSGLVDGDTLSGMVMDITERKRSEKEKDRMHAQLLHAQKMEAVGTLAGGIAHDFNNMLQAVLGYAQLLLFGKEKDEAGYKDIQEIVSAAGRGSELTRQLLTFSRKVESKRRPLNLNREVEQVRKLLERTIPKMIAIEIHLANDLETIDADPAQMEQVLMNLAVNAKDAMPEGGRLVIETKNTTLDSDYCKIHLEARTGDYVLLTVSDTGRGMDRKTQERIFEPFFTTKGPGKGTGLGLAMVYGIVKSHDGYIMCYSELDEGTTFKIYLPVIERRGETVEPQEAEVPPRGGTETILLVDDEPAIRKLGERVLRNSGYTVVAAPDGESALELYRKEQEHIDLVMLDLIMPGMGGKRCLEELVMVNPQVKVIIATGYSANGRTKKALETGARGCISKPYDARQMLKEVRDVLDED